MSTQEPMSSAPPATQADPATLSLTAAATDAPVLSPRPMTYTDVPTAVRTYEAAFKGDPSHHWLRDTSANGIHLTSIDYHGSALPMLGRRTEISALWGYCVTKGLAWTIDNGAAIICYGPAKSTLSRTDKAAVSVLVGALGMNTLGDREEEAIYLQILATTPEKQGRGYASALIRTVTGIADAQRRATFLLSSNLINTGFYNSFGFVEGAKIVLGNDDPTWREPPVVVLVGSGNLSTMRNVQMHKSTLRSRDTFTGTRHTQVQIYILYITSNPNPTS
ncbi:uncharacterized protein PHACADRAFT_185527 [Phanerochaete carnosa HHB-10118-sp]|uniref:N-acetyltransferase domain-containing protein n=1 Tax=Phanerochaete carnosa (strain HHB-10118-sp) TaxID=650164 RepID=K5WVX6_PHACS|nr:uncharacterized protein PHACADRAFT_185527 [Phanerochaete carnosa HHB-10118-sp]EKM54617.1 hypothetical protein PHACADRAFT_185527 [Phanerochaete carnosa HHB-10118-sp]